MVRVLAKGRSMTTPFVLSTLVAKRAEIAGIIAEMEQQLAQHRADLIHLDGVLRLLDSGIDPETIKPKLRVGMPGPIVER